MQMGSDADLSQRRILPEDLPGEGPGAFGLPVIHENRLITHMPLAEHVQILQT